MDEEEALDGRRGLSLGSHDEGRQKGGLSSPSKKGRQSKTIRESSEKTVCESPQCANAHLNNEREEERGLELC